MRPSRTRFAPSPTGYLHAGGARTALFAWLMARKSQGQFILRIEDTDQVREVPGAAQHIIDSLHWLGLQWDEGPDIGGVHGPYRQSQRLDIYKEWAKKLLESGRAYVDPYSAQQVHEFREQAKSTKLPFLYRNFRPLEHEDWDGRRALRFKSDPKSYYWKDDVMGELTSGPEAIDDFIILKADGYPTYNFAHIIDDHLMDITSVLRSQEFLASVPKYLNLYDALFFERPAMATLPYVLGPSGTKKLSKRDGAKDVLDYAREGYLPDALVTFLATLGWNDGTTKEIFTRLELLTRFDIHRVHRNSAKIDEQRLQWINSNLIRQLAPGELLKAAEPYWPATARNFDQNYKSNVLNLVKDRMKYFSQISSLTDFFFQDLPVNMMLITENKQLQAFDKTQLHSLLSAAITEISASDFSIPDLTNRLNGLLQRTNQKPAVLFSLIRIVTTWAPISPGLAETLAVLGKSTTLRRMNQALQVL